MTNKGLKMRITSYNNSFKIVNNSFKMSFGLIYKRKKDFLRLTKSKTVCLTVFSSYLLVVPSVQKPTINPNGYSVDIPAVFVQERILWFTFHCHISKRAFSINAVLCESGGKTRTKDKYRVVYTDKQRLELEKEFQYNHYITMRKKSELSATLALSERQVRHPRSGGKLVVEGWGAEELKRKRVKCRGNRGGYFRPTCIGLSPRSKDEFRGSSYFGRPCFKAAQGIWMFFLNALGVSQNGVETNTRVQQDFICRTMTL